MNVSSIGGLFGGLFMILLGQHIEGGHVGSLVQPSAFIIVIGGTCGCVLLQFGIHEIQGAFKMIVFIMLKGKHRGRKETIDQIMEFAQVSRRESIFALEKEMAKIEHPFMKAILGWVVDGKSSREIYEASDEEIESYVADNHVFAKVFEAFGGYLPTVGILGAVLGLIHVMENLSDPSKLGGGIAVAFVATLYGVGAANLVSLPLANKIKLYVEEEVILKKIIVRGLVMIVEGNNPALIVRELAFFLPEEERHELETEKKAG